MKTKNKSMWKICMPVCFIVYRLLLDKIYFSVISPLHFYEGFIDEHSAKLFVLSWICLAVSMIAIIPILNGGSERISSIVIIGLYFISYVPFTTCIYAGFLSGGYIVANNIYWIILILSEKYFLKRRIKRLMTFRMGNCRLDDKFVKLVGAFSLFLVIFISAKYTNFRLNFNMFSVYKLRNEASGYNFPTLIAYAFNWTKAINPILLAYCLLKKKFFMAIVYFVSQMFSFGIDGLKSTFFLPFVVIIAVAVYGKITTRLMKSLILIGVTGISVIGLLEFTILKSYFVIQLFIRRMEFTTHYIANCYYDFFTNNSPDYFRSSFLRYFNIISPYTAGGKSIGEVIADQYYYRSGVNFNNGLLSDAITNLGYLGIIIMPVVVIIILWLLDRSSHGLDKRLTIVSSLYIILVLLNSFMTTLLLTHGLLILMFLLSMMNRNNLEIGVQKRK